MEPRKYRPTELNEIIELEYRNGNLSIYHHGRNSWTKGELLEHLSEGHVLTRVGYCIPMEAVRESNEFANEVDKLMKKRGE